jgi:hypothetical protein
MGGGHRHAMASLRLGNILFAHCTGARWAPGPVWSGAENLAPPSVFDPWTVHLVASRFVTDGADY